MGIALRSCESSNKQGQKYPEQVRTNFVNSCAGKLALDYKKNCECVLEAIEKKYSLADYTQIENDIKAGKDVTAFLAFTDSVSRVCFPKK